MKQTKRTLKEHLAMELRAIRTLHPVNPKFFPVVTVKALLTAWLPYVTVYLSARILSELSGQRRPDSSERIREMGHCDGNRHRPDDALAGLFQRAGGNTAG